MSRMLIALFAISLTVVPVTAQTTRVAATHADKTNVSKPAVGTTKVAVFNIGIVLSKYDRAIAVKQAIAGDVKRFQAEAKELVQNLKTWETARMKSDISPDRKELYDEKIINAKRRLEDLDRQMRVQVSKSQDARLTELWKDVRGAVKAYADEHGLQLVIAYGDPKEAELVDAVPNIARKMQAMDQGGGVPFFVSPGVDISEAIVEMLNRQYREKKAESSEDDPK